MQFNWKVVRLVREGSVNGFSNVITAAHLVCEKVLDGKVEGWVTLLSYFPSPSEDSFKEYSFISEQDILSWINEEAKTKTEERLESLYNSGEESWEAVMPWENA